jgi:CheY-like chemotaxis protein
MPVSRERYLPTSGLAPSVIRRCSGRSGRALLSAPDAFGTFSLPERGRGGILSRQLEGLRSLVVDDNDDARRMLMIALDQYGARVTTAHSSAEGLEIFESLRPNVIVSDISMPGEDGHSFIANVRALEATRAGRVPAVAVTAYATEDDRAKALASGFNAYPARPCDAEDIVAVIAEVTGPGIISAVLAGRREADSPPNRFPKTGISCSCARARISRKAASPVT